MQNLNVAGRQGLKRNETLNSVDGEHENWLNNDKKEKLILHSQ